MISHLHKKISNHLKNTAFFLTIQGLCPLYTQLSWGFKGVKALP